MVFAFPGADVTGRRIAVHHRHLQIHEHQVKLAGAELLQRLGTVFRKVEPAAKIFQIFGDEKAILAGIIGDQNAQAMHGTGCRRLRRICLLLPGRTCNRCGHREPGGEINCRARAGLARNPNSSAHEFNQTLRNGEPQAAPAILSRRRCVSLLEGLKDGFEVLRRDSDARVRYHEMERAVHCGIRPHLESDVSLSSEPHGRC